MPRSILDMLAMETVEPESTAMAHDSINEVMAKNQSAYEPESGGLLGALKGRFMEGIINATRPMDYRLDILKPEYADEENPLIRFGKEMTGVISTPLKKALRFGKGFVGIPEDYVDEMTQKRFEGAFSQGQEERISKGILSGDFDIKDIVTAQKSMKDQLRKAQEARTDAFALGLGRPQRYGHFVESKERPSIGETDEESLYLDFKEGSEFKKKGVSHKYGEKTLPFGMSGKNLRGSVLGRYKETPTDDYTSYYDIWDFAGKHGLGKINTILEGLGIYKPHEIYGRVQS